MRVCFTWFAVLGLSSQVMVASAILNGDFESTSGYFSTDYLPYSGVGRLKYNEFQVTTSPRAVHDLFAQFGDHTTGSGNMLVINGGPNPEADLWEGEIGAPLSLGSQYVFSFWAASAFPESPGRLIVTVDGQQIGGEAVLSPNPGEWMRFTFSFTAQSAIPAIRMLDSNTDYTGNDFAIDDISLSAVPEPGTWVLLASGLLLAFRLRKR